MEYRLAMVKDLPAITECIGSTGYYGPVDASTLDGPIVVAVNKYGGIVGCIWILLHKRHAYVDFLAVNPIYKHDGIGVKLVLLALKTCKEHGAQYIRATIRDTNTETVRLANAMGAATDPNYTLAFVNLGE